MKTALQIMVVVILFTSIAFAGKGIGQQEKEFTVKMTLQEWNAIVTIVDDAAIDGKTRKHLIGRISTQVEPQLKDTTLPKPKGKP